MDREELKEFIRQKGLQLGFTAVGFTDAETLMEAGEKLDAWLANHFHGTMHWMQHRAAARKDPRYFFKDARSVVVVLQNYYRSDEAISRPPEEGNISIYARGRDYHRVLRNKLKKLLQAIQSKVPEATGRVCVDSFPLMEKPLAVRAGLGWIGKNTNLLRKKVGSYFFLGELLLNIELPPDEPLTADYCGNCTRCLDACPTGALVQPYVLDARRCISYLTIEHREDIPAALQPQMGNWVFGCDICQEVCPWNRFSTDTLETDFKSRIPEEMFRLTSLIKLTENKFQHYFRGTPVMRAGYQQFMRNVQIAWKNWKSGEDEQSSD